jgi:hypothetical protein
MRTVYPVQQKASINAGFLVFGEPLFTKHPIAQNGELAVSCYN